MESAETVVAPSSDDGITDGQDYAEAEVIDEDDMVIVPAPPMEALGHFHHHDHAPARPARPPAYQSLGYRQTIIPILLTTGLALFVIGAAHWVVDPDSPLGLQGLWFPALLMVMGTIALGLGVLSMLQIRHLLASRPD